MRALVLAGLALAALAALVLFARPRAPVTSLAPAVVGRAPASEADGGALVAPGAARADVRHSERERALAAPAAESTAAPSAAATAVEDVAGVVEGAVLDDEGPVAGAEVRIVLLRGGTTQELAVAATDAEGGFSVLVPALARLQQFERECCEVEARVRARGHCPNADSKFVDPRSGAVFDLEVLLQPGVVLSGRVLAPDGAPVAGARARLSASGSQAVSDDQGRFQLPLYGAGQDTLVVSAADAGTLERELELASPPRDLDLGDCVLDPKGALEGRLRFADGTPAAGVPIGIWPVIGTEAVVRGSEGSRMQIELLGEDEALLRVLQDRRPGEMSKAFASAGLGPPRARTDPQGRFRILGLPDGRWTFLSPFYGPTAITGKESTYITGRRDIELELEGTFLRAQIVDDSGRPMPGAELQIERISDDGPAPDRAARARRNSSARAETTQGERAEVLVPIEPLTRYSVRASLSGAEPAEVVVATGDAGSLTQVRLVLVVAPPTSALRIVLPAELAAIADGFKVRLLAPSSGSELASFQSFECDAAGFSPPLPPGEWALSVQPRSSRTPAIAYWRQEPPLPAVTLAEGERRALEVGFRLCGRMRLTGPKSRAAQVRLDFFAPGAADPTPLAWTGRDAGGRGDAVTLLATEGECESLDLLAPGVWRVIVTGIDRRVRELACEVRPGETSELALR